MCVIDAGGRIEEANRALRAICEREQDGLERMSLWEIMHSADVPRVREQLDREPPVSRR